MDSLTQRGESNADAIKRLCRDLDPDERRALLKSLAGDDSDSGNYGFGDTGGFDGEATMTDNQTPGNYAGDDEGGQATGGPLWDREQYGVGPKRTNRKPSISGHAGDAAPRGYAARFGDAPTVRRPRAPLSVDTDISSAERTGRSTGVAADSKPHEGNDIRYRQLFPDAQSSKARG
jgi:hypothetical protein